MFILSLFINYLIAAPSNCPTILYDICVCQNPVVGGSTDGNGYVYGSENGNSCIVAKSGDRPTANPSYVSNNIVYCRTLLYGYCTCSQPVVNGAVDSNGYTWGQEYGRSCIVPRPGDSTVPNPSPSTVPNPSSTVPPTSTRSTATPTSAQSLGCVNLLYGFCVCQSPVSNPAVDANGYQYGNEFGRSCIVAHSGDAVSRNPNPITLTSGVPSPITTSAAPTSSPSFGCVNLLYGFCVCQGPVSNPSVDGNGYQYGNQYGRSCIVARSGDPVSVNPNPIPLTTVPATTVPPTSSTAAPTSSQSLGCVNLLYGFCVCQSPVSNPAVDANGYQYGNEFGRSCIVAHSGDAVSRNPNPITLTSGVPISTTFSSTSSTITPTPSVGCVRLLYGYCVCEKTPPNPVVDANGYLYGNEFTQTCIVPHIGDNVSVNPNPITLTLAIPTTTASSTSTWIKPTWTPSIPAPINGVCPNNALPQLAFAPFVLLHSYPEADLDAYRSIVGTRHFVFAFILADSNGQPSWNGQEPISGNYAMSEINKIRCQGGEVIISFGGAGGTELAMGTQNVAELQAKYQSVIDRYSARWVDFDIEMHSINDEPSIIRRHQAIRGLQQANPNLRVMFSIPVAPYGLVRSGIAFVQAAKDNGVRIDLLNIMTMCYYLEEDPTGKMGTYAISAAISTRQQTLAMGLDLKIGITPMIGQNDNPKEVFTQADAEQVISWARTQFWISFVSYWSVIRDRGVSSPYLGLTSNIEQGLFEFGQIFQKYM